MADMLDPPDDSIEADYDHAAEAETQPLVEWLWSLSCGRDTATCGLVLRIRERVIEAERALQAQLAERTRERDNAVHRADVAESTTVALVKERDAAKRLAAEWLEQAQDMGKLAEERLVHANQLQADIEAEQSGRLELRKRFGADPSETMGQFITRLATQATYCEQRRPTVDSKTAKQREIDAAWESLGNKMSAHIFRSHPEPLTRAERRAYWWSRVKDVVTLREFRWRLRNAWLCLSRGWEAEDPDSRYY